LSAAFRVAEMAVEDSHLAEPAAEALNRLWRQADLRHEHKGLLALPHDFLDGAQVNLGLAAAGDAIEEKRLKAALLNGLLDGGPCLKLVGIQRDGGFGLRLLLSVRVELVDAPHDAPRQSLLYDRVDGALAAAGELGQLPDLDRLRRRAQVFQHLRLLGAEVRRGRRQFDFRYRLQKRRRAGAGQLLHPGRNDRVEHLAPAAQVVVRHPARQAQQVGREQRLVVQDLQDLFDFPLRSRFGQTDTVANRHLITAAKGHLETLADRDQIPEWLRDRVAVGLIQRPVEDDSRIESRLLLW